MIVVQLIARGPIVLEVRYRVRSGRTFEAAANLSHRAIGGAFGLGGIPRARRVFRGIWRWQFSAEFSAIARRFRLYGGVRCVLVGSDFASLNTIGANQ